MFFLNQYTQAFPDSHFFFDTRIISYGWICVEQLNMLF